MVNFMQFVIYKTLDADNVINKTLTDARTIEMFLTARTNIINPTIPFSKVEGINIYDYNYCAFPELGRFYFINSIENINAKIFNLECSCDVLMTYKDDILNSNARVMRSIKEGDYYNADMLSNIISSPNIYTSNSGFNKEVNYILSTVGA